MRIENCITDDNAPSIERHVQWLIRKVPEAELVGLERIILLDRVLDKRVKSAWGLYRAKTKGQPAAIELAAGEIFRGAPRWVFTFSVIPRILLGYALYHEIGHHHQYTAHHNVGKKEGEALAEKYRRQYMRSTFWGWYIVLLSSRWLIGILRKIFPPKRRLDSANKHAKRRDFGKSS